MSDPSLIQTFFKAVEELFSFLKSERDPSKQQRRRANYEYKVLKEAVKTALRAYRLSRLVESEGNPARRKVY